MKWASAVLLLTLSFGCDDDHDSADLDAGAELVDVAQLEPDGAPVDDSVADASPPDGRVADILVLADMAVDAEACPETMVRVDGVCICEEGSRPRRGAGVDGPACVPARPRLNCDRAIADERPTRFVAPGGDGDGTQVDPMGTLVEALDGIEPGSRIFLLPGEHPVEPLTRIVVEDLVIEGGCAENTRLRSQGEVGPVATLFITASGVVLRGLTLETLGPSLFVGAPESSRG